MSLDDITAKMQAQAEDIVNEAEIIVEELKADILKEDETITKTIEEKKACILDSKNKKSSSSIFTHEYKKSEKPEEKEDEKPMYSYSYNYGYNYGSKPKEKTEDEKKRDEAKSKVKSIFSENAERVSFENDAQDIFVLYGKTIRQKQKKPPTKTTDVLGRGLIGALLDCAKNIMIKLESED